MLIDCHSFQHSPRVEHLLYHTVPTKILFSNPQYFYLRLKNCLLFNSFWGKYLFISIYLSFPLNVASQFSVFFSLENVLSNIYKQISTDFFTFFCMSSYTIYFMYFFVFFLFVLLCDSRYCSTCKTFASGFYH